MSKSTPEQMKRWLTHSIMVALEFIRGSANELRTIQFTDKEWESKRPNARVKRAKELMKQMNMANMIIAPYFELARDIFPEMEEFWKICEENYKQAVTKDGVMQFCDCWGCAPRDKE